MADQPIAKMTIIVRRAITGEVVLESQDFSEKTETNELYLSVAEKLGQPQNLITLVHNGKVLMAMESLGAMGLVHPAEVSVVIQMDDAAKRLQMAHAGDFKAAFDDLDRAMREHEHGGEDVGRGRGACSFGCELYGGKLQLVQHLRCESPPGANPFGPCGNCRQNLRSVRATRCPEAGMLNMELDELKQLEERLYVFALEGFTGPGAYMLNDKWRQLPEKTTEDGRPVFRSKWNNLWMWWHTGFWQIGYELEFLNRNTQDGQLGTECMAYIKSKATHPLNVETVSSWMFRGKRCPWKTVRVVKCEV